MTLVKKFILTRKDSVDIYEYSSNLEIYNRLIDNISSKIKKN